MGKKFITPEIKNGIIEAFDQVGGVDYLIEIARRDPPTFCRLLAAIIPSEIKASVATTNKLDLGKAMMEAEQRVAMLEHNQ